MPWGASALGGECSHTCGFAAEWTAEPEGLCRLVASGVGLQGVELSASLNRIRMSNLCHNRRDFHSLQHFSSISCFEKVLERVAKHRELLLGCNLGAEL
jgi:hypothetical protein